MRLFTPYPPCWISKRQRDECNGIVHFVLAERNRVLPGSTALNPHRHTPPHTQTHTASPLWPLHPAVRMMTQCFNRICRGFMPREEFPRCRLRESTEEIEVMEGRERKSPDQKKKRVIRIKGAAIEPRRLLHRELIIVLGGEKRRPYYSPVHNRNS